MDAAYKAREIIYLVDDGCIADHERSICKWFSETINTYKNNNFPIFCIASRYIVHIKNRPQNDRFYFIELNELNNNERKRLFTKLIRIVSNRS